MSYKRFFSISLTLSLSVLMLAVLLNVFSAEGVRAAPAATITVDTAVDENDGSCSDGDCSLRDAIAVAAPDDIIDFALSTPVTITLASPLRIEQDLSIVGPGADQLFLSGDNAVTVLTIYGGNVAISDLTVTRGNTTGSGGGMTISGDEIQQPLVTLTSVDFISNTAQWGGGLEISGPGLPPTPALDNYATLVMNGGVIRDNVAGSRGGGLNAAYTVTIELNNVAISNNRGSFGGGLEILASRGTLDGVVIKGNEGTSGGGGLSVARNAQVELLSGQIMSNAVSSTFGVGGGVIAYDGAVFTHTGGIITYNNGPNGGGISSGYYSAPGTVVIQGGQILSNTATNGGGINLSGNSVLNMIDGTVAYNLADYGGGVYSSQSTATINGGQILSNTAVRGGGVNLDYEGILTVTNGTVAYNLADYGGGVYSSYSSATINGGQILSNTAVNYGGGVALMGTSAFTMSAGTVAQNAANNGGGIYAGGGTAQISGGQIMTNSAVWNGGGIYANAPLLTLAGGTIDGNQASQGAGLLVASQGTVETGASLTIDDDVAVWGTFNASTYPLMLNGSLAMTGWNAVMNAPADLTVTGPFTHTYGVFNQTRDVTGSGAVGFPKAGGLILDAAGQGDLGSTAVSIHAGYNCTAIHGETVHHCYTITPTNSSGVQPTVTFFYNDAELIDHQCNSLNAYRWDGSWSNVLTLDSGYDGDGRLCDSSPYSVQAQGVSEFGDYVLASTLLSVNDVMVAEGDSGANTAVFTVTRTGAHSTSSVLYETTDDTATAGSDYTAVPSTSLSFAANETEKTLSVSVNGDTTFEPDEIFFVDFSNPTDAILVDAQGAGTIDNDDPGPAGLGPGGVSTIDGLSDLTLWLRGGAGIVLNGGSVEKWQDQSNNSHHATQTYEPGQPVYQSSELNGQPVLQFSGYAMQLGGLSDSFPTAATVFVATTITDTDAYGLYSTSFNWPQYYWYAWGASELAAFRTGKVSGYPATLPTSGTHIFSLESSASNYELFQNGTSQGAQAGSYSGGNSHQIGNALQGDVAEVIAFSTALNSAQRTLVENYLSAKYDTAISNDRYVGDDGANGDYDWDVAGLGQEADGNHTVAASSGLRLSHNSFLQDNGDYVLAGHKTPSIANTPTELPSGGDWDSAPNPQRWTRDWYVAVTDSGGNGGAVDLIFDFSEAGMSGAPAGALTNYRLLWRSGSSGAFTDLGTADAISGDQVTFSGIDVSTLNGGTLTLGTLDAGSSPTAVSLQSFSAQQSNAGGALLYGGLSLLALGLIVWLRRRSH